MTKNNSNPANLVLILIYLVLTLKNINTCHTTGRFSQIYNTVADIALYLMFSKGRSINSLAHILERSGNVQNNHLLMTGTSNLCFQ